MVNVMKGGGRAPPPPPAWPNFTLMTECTPESRRYYSVYSVSCVLEVRPARRADACAPLLAVGGENLLCLSPPVKETVQ